MNLKTYIADHAAAMYLPAAVGSAFAAQNNPAYDDNRFVFSCDKAQLIAQGLTTPEQINAKMLAFFQDLTQYEHTWAASKGWRNGDKRFELKKLEFKDAIMAYHNSSFSGTNGVSDAELNDNLLSCGTGEITTFNQPSKFDVEPHFHMVFPKSADLGQSYNSIIFGVAALAREHGLTFHFMEDASANLREEHNKVTSLTWKIESLSNAEFKKWIKKDTQNKINLIFENYKQSDDLQYFIKSMRSLKERLKRADIDVYFDGYNLKESFPLPLSEQNFNTFSAFEYADTKSIQILLENRANKAARAFLEHIAGFNNVIINELSSRGFAFKTHNLDDLDLSKIQPPKILEKYENLATKTKEEILEEAKKATALAKEGEIKSEKMTLHKAILMDLQSVLTQARSEKEIKDLLTIKGWSNPKIKSKNGERIGIQVTDQYGKNHMLLFAYTPYKAWPEIRKIIEENSKNIKKLFKDDTSSAIEILKTQNQKNETKTNNDEHMVSIESKQKLTKNEIERRRAVVAELNKTLAEKEKIEENIVQSLLQNRNRGALSQDAAFDKIIEKDAGFVFLTGEGGSGKSFLTRRVIEAEKKAGKEVQILATTGIAAVNIGEGRTLHSFFGIGICKDKKELAKLDAQDPGKVAHILDVISKTNTIVLDEVSMLHKDQAELIEYRLQQANFQGKLLFVGDFLQLPPVEEDKTKARYAFESDMWKKNNVETIKIAGNKRVGDGTSPEKEQFVEMLNRLRYGDSSPDLVKYFEQFENHDIQDEDATFIFNTNREVAQHNAVKLAQLDGKELKYKARYQEDGESVTPTPANREKIHKEVPPDELLNLKEGAKIMLVTNDHAKGYVNGDRGVFLGEKNGKLLVRVDRTGAEIEIGKKQFESEWVDDVGKDRTTKVTAYPIRLAYAITTHKSQGMSLDIAQVSASNIFEFAQLYVAISRAKDPSALKIVGTKDFKKGVKIDFKCLSFMHPEFDMKKLKNMANEIKQLEESLKLESITEKTQEAKISKMSEFIARAKAAEFAKTAQPKQPDKIIPTSTAARGIKKITTFIKEAKASEVKEFIKEAKATPPTSQDTVARPKTPTGNPVTLPSKRKTLKVK